MADSGTRRRIAIDRKIDGIERLYRVNEGRSVGRLYAGILGPLAVVAVVFQAVRRGGGIEATLIAAELALIVFAILGYVLGQLAGWIVEDSVRSKVLAQRDRA